MSTSAISSVSPATPAVPADPPAAKTTAVGYSRTSSLDLTLTTRDGDTVTISAQQTTTAGVSRIQGADGDAIASAKATSSSLSVMVDGSLDPHELADIKKVLKTLADGARTQGLHGHHHGHHHRGQEGQEGGGRQGGRGGLSTIASVSGSFSSSVAVLGGVLYGAPASGDQTTSPAVNAAAAAADEPATTDVPAAA